MQTSDRAGGIRRARRVVFYDVVIEKRDRSLSWNVLRRFSEFDSLNKALEARYGRVKDFSFPKKGLQTLVKSKKIVEDRKVLLARYLQRCLDDNVVCRSEELKVFLNPARRGGWAGQRLKRGTLGTGANRGFVSLSPQKGGSKENDGVDSESDSDLELSTEDLGGSQDLRPPGSRDVPAMELLGPLLKRENVDPLASMMEFLETVLPAIMQDKESDAVYGPFYRMLVVLMTRSWAPTALCLSINGTANGTGPSDDATDRNVQRGKPLLGQTLSSKEDRSSTPSLNSANLEHRAVSFLNEVVKEVGTIPPGSGSFSDILGRIVQRNVDAGLFGHTMSDVVERFADGMPGHITRLLGFASSIDAITFTFESLQNATLNKHLLYTLIDITAEEAQFSQ
ncbi:hypothetical protein M427DRAFT_306468 [Gonapodya prolifera JEL478]|uniref:PX domain-containing protein n=1 Tax=Gonapodya prolifera (strain JEL478) TaxID=1344416 RepID=A0A139AGQ4_GONPJ|nr:hypothetical protein M427DRAFT_306468 [Gonapodya prolifera JEL478]|eukprot:KXS15967.1 hypothetical protein M427DRAFT_306468 [Gonapodya prolifera JEL478]